MVRSLPVALSLVVLFSGHVVLPAAAQQAVDSVRVKALHDFHGPDETGKDGPLSAAGLDLLILYHRFQAADSQDDFTPAKSGLPVSDGRVTVDAIARADADELRSDLEELGMTNTAAAGRIVSGRLPIAKIPEAARLQTLRGLTVPQAQTRTQPPSPSDVSTAPVEAEPARTDDESSGETDGGLSLLIVGGIVLLLMEEF